MSRAGVVTVTVNPAVDHTVWVPGFTAGEVNRVVTESTRPGGKGVNVAARLALLGIATAATGFLGSDNAGVFESFMADRGIQDRFLRRAGATRTGIKIVDDTAQTTTDVNFPGASPGPGALDRLAELLASLSASAAWVVLAGSLPPDVPTNLYRELVNVARGGGALVAVDTSGPALVDAMAARPDLVKPNRDELSELTGRRLDDDGAVVSAARGIQESGVATVVVSLGEGGAVFSDGSGAVRAGRLDVPVASTVGAGDAMVAGTIAGRIQGLGLDALASLATACSAAAISSVGAEIDRDELERLAANVPTEWIAEPTANDSDSNNDSNNDRDSRRIVAPMGES